MSSSTSSSRTALLALALCGLALLSAEIFLRRAGTRLSGDLAHYEEIPIRVGRLEPPALSNIIVLGNSQVRAGIREGLLASGLAASGLGERHIAVVHPDDTTAIEWAYLVESDFGAPSAHYKGLIVGFAREQLADQPLAFEELSRLAALSPLGELGTIIRMESLDFGSAAEFLLCKLSRSFAWREAVQKRVLDRLIPSYRETAQHINGVQRAEADASRAGRTAPTYRHLKRLLDAANRRQAADVLFVALPYMEPYPVRQELRDLFEEHGAELLDLSAGTGLSPEDFKDSLHLTAAGAEKLTRRLVAHLLAGNR